MKIFYVLFLLLPLLIACGNIPPQQEFEKLTYSTSSDSARYYYDLGWHQIMDEGRYGQAEVSYRKALHFDPQFLLAKATLGRLILDSTERRQIERELSGQSTELPADEGALLELYTDFVRFTNVRDHSPAAAKKMLLAVLPKGQETLGRLVHKYPESPYLKSEYVELINANEGALSALDSLADLTKNRHAKNPFLLGFKASLLAEEKQFSEALGIAQKLEAMTADTTEPKPWAIYADIYFKMDSLIIAKKYADCAYQLDERNLDASRLKEKIDSKLIGLD